MGRHPSFEPSCEAPTWHGVIERGTSEPGGRPAAFAGRVEGPSGGSGGVFSPSLFLGAVLGGVYGAAVHHIFPTWTAQPGAYAMVAMGALFAGAAHAPITSVLILFEMTNNYAVILPLMLAVVVATLVA